MKNSIPSIRTSVSRSSWRFFTAISFCFACGAGLLHATPGPTYSFDTGTGADQIVIDGGGVADANVAASSTHICVTARGAFACYTKSGALVSVGPRYEVRPYMAAEFFTQAGIQVPNVVVPGNDPVKDGRVVFERYLKRFFMVFQSRESPPRLLIAVSKSEDPRDGWWTYSDNVQTADLNGQDWMSVGINASHLLVSNHMHKCTGTYNTPTWACTPVRARHLMYAVADLAAGKKPYGRSEWSDSAAVYAAPAVHDSYSTDAFWVSRDNATQASVWAVRNGNVTRRKVTIQTATGPVNGPQLGGSQVSYTNIGLQPQDAHYRNGRIVFVANVGHTWSGQSSANNAVHVVRVDVSKIFDPSPGGTVEINKIFGRSSAGDPSGVIYDYGWPAVAVNTNGDIVVGSVRSHSSIYPELRASVWFAGQPAISPGVSLAKSTALVKQFHMAGASADPSTTGVYLAQAYGSSSPPLRIRVVKMLGEVMPDLIATQVKPPATIAHGASGNVIVTVMNQGDGPMPASTGKLYLSTDKSIHLLGPDIKEDPVVATFTVEALAPGQVATKAVPFTVAATQVPGDYFVGAAIYSGSSEYSKTNNVNPFLTGDHGNAPITVN
jgi:hypothetical protein